MNTTQRFLLGLLSSFLLAAGLARAADRLDPLTAEFRTATLNHTPMDSGPSCGASCVSQD